jgi:WD40 repeat protein
VGHSDWVRAIAIAPDGSWLATASPDGTARIWDVGTGQQQAVLAGHTSEVRTIDIAPDGCWLATTGWDGTARIWDVKTGWQRNVLADGISAVTIASRGNWLAAASWDGTLRIWDQAWSNIAVMRVHGSLHDCQWSLHGHLLAAVGKHGLYYFTFKP